MKSDSVKAIIYAGAALGVLYVGWQAYKRGKEAADKLGAIAADVEQSFTQARANAESWLANNFSAPAPVSTKAWLYSDYGYAGTDVNGVPIIEGEWYSNPDARRYDVAQRENGTPPAATSINGAAFGVYRAPVRRTTDARAQLSTAMQPPQPEGSW
jgi:hypothetical protein